MPERCLRSLSIYEQSYSQLYPMIEIPRLWVVFRSPSLILAGEAGVLWFDEGTISARTKGTDGITTT
jgi:hypothetical protein